MRLDRALLCADLECQEVFEMNGTNHCPKCGCTEVYPVSRRLNKEEPATEVQLLHQRTKLACSLLRQLHLDIVKYDNRMIHTYDDYAESEDANILGNVLHFLEGAVECAQFAQREFEEGDPQ